MSLTSLWQLLIQSIILKRSVWLMALIEKLQRGERVDMIFFLFDYEL